MTKQEFLNKFKEKHSTKFINFDFSNLPEEFSTKDYFPFICKVHGKLEPIRIDSFLFNGKCPLCSRKTYSNKGKRKKSIEEFIEKCKKIHVWKEEEPRDIEKYPTGSPKYDYSITKEFKSIPNKRSKFEIDYICPIHGPQTQRADMHEHGAGCLQCGHILSGLNQRLSPEEFYNKCRKIHVWRPNDIRDKNLYPDWTPKYDYSKSDFTGYGKYFHAYCPLHNHTFRVLSTNHYQGVPGCEYCSGTGTSSV